MFGFSLQKLMVLAGIIGAVWYGFKLVGRMKAARDAEQMAQGGRPAAGGFAEGLKRWSSRSRGPAGPARAEDMVPCKVCGAYVSARGATACGRADCPY